MNLQSRDQLPAFLTHHRLTGLGVELGVASGRFSEHLLKNAPIRRLYSVDAWAGDRGHDIRQQDAATRRLSKYGARSIVLRATFDEALPLFENGSLDFVYIDGYAHEGNSGETLRGSSTKGRSSATTLENWWPKVKPGGFFGGHDYCEDRWPKNVRAVDRFRREVRIAEEAFFVTEGDEFPSWGMLRG